jgi:L-asparaginase II
MPSPRADLPPEPPPGRDPAAAGTEKPYADNPVQVRLVRGHAVESVHRGAWVLSDVSGRVLAHSGDPAQPIFARSAVKAFQALPLIESGAAARFGYSESELALALASHDAEPGHTEPVLAVLGRLGLGVEHLRCGPQVPGNRDARQELAALGLSPTALHNNCSGKHAGFLTLATHLGVPPEEYLAPESAGQRLVRAALADLAGLAPMDLEVAVDGCSAPTFRLPLAGLATAYARLADPSGLAPERAAACRRVTAAAAHHPELIAGSSGRLCTDLSRVSGGRLFPKIGAEGVYGIGLVGSGLGLAVKVDDGQHRGLHPLVVALVERLGWLGADALEALEGWRERRLVNRAGLVVGRTEVASTLDALPGGAGA